MRRILPGLVLFAALCVLPSSVEAGEVVEFSDGRYLEIRSYVVQGDLIRLDVAPESFMVIPVVSVDEIRRDRDVVFSSNRAVPPEAQTTRVTSFRREHSDRARSEVSLAVGSPVTTGS
jgi:hypothetical protein